MLPHKLGEMLTTSISVPGTARDIAEVPCKQHKVISHCFQRLEIWNQNSGRFGVLCGPIGSFPCVFLRWKSPKEGLSYEH